MESQPNFRWSFSQWEAYESCPAKWAYANRHKLPRLPPGPAAERGLDMHDRCEKYILGELPPDRALRGEPGRRFGGKGPAIIADKYLVVLNQFKDHPNGDRYCELEVSLDRDWDLCGGSLLNPKFVNGFMDAVRVESGVAYVGEWKSGQPKPTHKDQRLLYALFAFRKFLGIEEARVTTYYLEDTAPPQQLVVKASAEDKLKTIWLERASMMERDEICAPKPNAGCRWCDYRREAGGPCEFG